MGFYKGIGTKPNLGGAIGWPGGEVKVTKKKIKPFSSLSWP